MLKARAFAQRWGWVVLTLYLATFFVQKTNLITSDLGRHLTNGRVILEAGQVFSTNFYSYTFPEFATVNHHWMFGVFMHLLHQVGGFPVLTLANVGLILLTFGLMLRYCWQHFGARATSIATLILLPLLTKRVEIRPETVSLLLSAVFFLLLQKYESGTLKTPTLLVAIVLLNIVWVNTHLFFVLGGALIGYFWLRAAARKNWQQFRVLGLLGLLSATSWLLNPVGIAGLLEPFGIFKEYGYQVLENQPIWVLLRVLPQPIYWYLLVGLLGVVGLLFWAIWQRRHESHRFVDGAYALLLSAGSLYLYRLSNFTALLIMPLLAEALSQFLHRYQRQLKSALKSTAGTMCASVAGFALTVSLLGSGMLTPELTTTGLGVFETNDQAAKFWHRSNLEGPIFNNYDIGGYLIYHLYPEEKVFIDNRPEAYPASFFTESYIPAQENEQHWEELQNKYQFNAIFFNRRDLTPWGQALLVRTIQNENWVPVFVDTWTIIFARKNSVNQAVIDQYQLPKEMFSISP